jgi:hypothetical protein
MEALGSLHSLGVDSFFFLFSKKIPFYLKGREIVRYIDKYIDR